MNILFLHLASLGQIFPISGCSNLFFIPPSGVTFSYFASSCLNGPPTWVSGSIAMSLFSGRVVLILIEYKALRQQYHRVENSHQSHRHQHPEIKILRQGKHGQQEVSNIKDYVKY